MIYVIKHKQYDNPQLKGYKDLYVGDLFQYNDKDNINDLNKYINEATGLYHIYANCNDDIVGLVHYRRYFIKDNDYLKYEEVENILKIHDIILPNNVVFDKGIYEQLRIEMPNEYERQILDKYYNMLCKKEPGLIKYFKEKEFAPKEMFVCKKDIIDKYCKWLFDLILPITYNFIMEDKDKLIQQRMIGHLIERLFYYWVEKNNLKIYRLDYKDI